MQCSANARITCNKPKTYSGGCWMLAERLRVHRHRSGSKKEQMTVIGRESIMTAASDRKMSEVCADSTPMILRRMENMRGLKECNVLVFAIRFITFQRCIP